MKVSICITTYEANGKGAEFFRRNMIHCLEQTYRPLEIVISDHSKDTSVEEEVKRHTSPDIDIQYIRYEEHRGSPCANWNNAVKHATGDMIRIMALDDYLAYPDAISDSMRWIENRPEKWFVSHRIDEKNGVKMKRAAYWNSNILKINTLSGPSCVMLPKSIYTQIELDRNLVWLLDLDWYFRLYETHGKPGFIPYYTWVNSQHDNQLSHHVNTREPFETEILKSKYGSNLPMSE